MSRRAYVEKHSKHCKHDHTAPVAGGDEEEGQPKPGKYGVYGDEVPQFVLDCVQASDAEVKLGVWLEHQVSWKDIGPS